MTDRKLRYPGKNFRLFFDQELEKYRQAAKNDPDDPVVLACLAESWINLWCYGFLSYEQSIPAAKSAALKAVELDDGLAMAHMVSGIIHLAGWDWPTAGKELKKAIELEPHQYKNRHWYALYLSAMLQHDRALQQSEISVRLAGPEDSMIGYASILYFAHKFEEMADLLEKALHKETDFAPIYDWLGMAYVQLEKYDQSIDVYRKATNLSDGLAEIKAGLGHAYGIAGRMNEAQAIMDEFTALAGHYYIPPVQMAFVAFGLGKTDMAFDLLERAFRERSWELVFIATEPWFDPLHDDPRFLDLIKRIGLPQKATDFK